MIPTKTSGIQSEAVQMASANPLGCQTALETTQDATHEQQIVRAVLAGNTSAYQTLIETHQQRVYNLALRMLGNEREAEDAAQDAFVQAFTRLHSYNPEWRFKTWVMTITSNLCIDKLRRRKLEPTSFTDYAMIHSDGDDERELDFESRELLPDQVAAQNEQHKMVQAMLKQIPVEDRGMVVMFYWDDLSYEDIAKSMNTTVSAVKSRLFRARKALAQLPLAQKING